VSASFASLAFDFTNSCVIPTSCCVHLCLPRQLEDLGVADNAAFEQNSLGEYTNSGHLRLVSLNLRPVLRKCVKLSGVKDCFLLCSFAF